jgi:hypothetical protein
MNVAGELVMHLSNGTVYTVAMPETQPDKQFVHVLLDMTLLDRIDRFWHNNRFPTRAEAFRWLIQARSTRSSVPKKPAKGE